MSPFSLQGNDPRYTPLMGTWGRYISVAFMCLAVFISLVPSNSILSPYCLLQYLTCLPPWRVWLIVIDRLSAYLLHPLN